MKIKIMRGVPGSGKSTVAKAIRQEAVDMEYHPYIVSADDYFVKDGQYQFDPTKLGDAHRFCMKSFLFAVNDRMSPIIVDNTNINLEDVAPYVAVGEALGYDVEVVQVDTEPTIAAGRNVHGVQMKKVLEMYDRMQRTRLPKRWKVTKYTPTT
jgi:predicted kinase